MKLFVFALCCTLAFSMPPEEDTRQGRNILTDLLGTIGIIRIVPRSCTSTSSLLRSGMCAFDSDCGNLGGAVAGACPRLGSCCVVPAVCNSATKARRSWYINKGFPGAVSSYSDLSCELTIEKSDETIKQVKLDFEMMELSRSDNGACIKDSFHVIQANAEGTEVELAPPLCGDNKGQHMYIDMPTKEGYKLKLRTKLSPVNGEKDKVERQWRVLITQLDEKEAVPTGCLQYYDATAGKIRSLNYDASDADFVYNQEYDICFKNLDKFEQEQAEEDTDKTAIHSCSRSAFGVSIEQSFVKNTRVRRESVKQSGIIRAEDTMGESLFSSDDVKTQIEQVVSQLSGNKESGLMSVIKEANHISKSKVKDEENNIVEAVIKKEEENMMETGAEEQEENKKTKPAETSEVESSMSEQEEKETSKNKPSETETTGEKNAAENKDTIETLPDENKTESDAENEEEKFVLKTKLKKPMPEVVLKAEEESPEPSVILVSLPEEEKFTLTPEMEVALESADCGGNYLLVRGLRICGDFFRNTVDSTKRDVRFANMERISLRSLGNPDTALRFTMDYKVSCVTTEPPEIPADTNTPQRRVNVIQYLLGLY